MDPQPQPSVSRGPAHRASSSAGNIHSEKGNKSPSTPSKIPHRASTSKSHRSSSSLSFTPTHGHHHNHATSTPKHDNNPHPYAIKTTSTALLSRSSSRSSSHYDSYHHYVPSSPSPTSPTVKKGIGYGYGGASESEGEDGSNGTGRHRYSRSLTGDDVPPLPPPPPKQDIEVEKGKESGVLYVEPEGLKSENEEDDTPRKNARARAGAKELFTTPVRGHKHSQSHASYLRDTKAPEVGMQGPRTEEVKRHYTTSKTSLNADGEGPVDEPLPSSDPTSSGSGLDRGWTFKKGSMRLKNGPMNNLEKPEDDDDDNESVSSRSSMGSQHSRSSSVLSNRSGRVRNMVESLERSSSVSSGIGLDEEGSVSESHAGEMRLEGRKRGSSPVKRDFAINAVGASSKASKPLPVRASVHDLFGPVNPQIDMEDEDADTIATLKKREDDATVTNKNKPLLNGREPRLLPFPPTMSAAQHQHQGVLTPSHTGTTYSLPPSPQQDRHIDHLNTGASPLSAHEFGVKKGWNQFGYPTTNHPQPQHTSPRAQSLSQTPLHSHSQPPLHSHQPLPPPHQQHMQHPHQQQYLDPKSYPPSHLNSHSQPQHSHSQPQHSYSQPQNVHPQPRRHHRIPSPQTQRYVVRHNPSPGITSPDSSGRGGGGSPDIRGHGSPASGNGRGSAGSTGKRLLPFPPVVQEGELHHPRPKRVIGVIDDEGEKSTGKAKRRGDGRGANNLGDDEKLASGVESGVEGYYTALETAGESSGSLESDGATLVEHGHFNKDADKPVVVDIKVHDVDGDEPSIEDLLRREDEKREKRGEIVGEGGLNVSGVEAWEMELGETVKRISASLRVARKSGGGGGSVRGPRSTAGAGLGITQDAIMNGLGIGVHEDGSVSVGDVSSKSIGRKAGTRSEERGLKRGGVLELFNIPAPSTTIHEATTTTTASDEYQQLEHDLEEKQNHLQSLEQSLSRRDYSLVEKDYSLIERETQLEERNRIVGEREQDLDARERVLDKFKDALDVRAQGMDKRGVMLEDREKDVRIREGELDERENKLDERDGRVNEREQAGRVWEGEMGEREWLMDEREKRLDEREDKLNERERKLDIREEGLEEREAEVERAKVMLEAKEEDVLAKSVGLEKREEKVVDNERKIKNRLKEVQNKEKENEEKEVGVMKKDEERKARARSSAEVEMSSLTTGLEGRERDLEKKEKEMEERERAIKVKEETLHALEHEVNARARDQHEHPLWPLPISLLRKGWGTFVMPLIGEERTPGFLLPYQIPRRRSFVPGAYNDDDAEQDQSITQAECNTSVVSTGSTSTVTPNKSLRKLGNESVTDAPTSSTTKPDGDTSPSTTTASTLNSVEDDRNVDSSRVVKRDFFLGRLGFMGERSNGGYWVLMSIGMCVAVLKALSMGGVRGVGGVLRGTGRR